MVTAAVYLEGEAWKDLAGGEIPWDWHHWIPQWLTLMAFDGSPLGAYELTLTLTDDAGIQSLNRDYRQRDQPTDVLAFATLEDAVPLPPELLAQDPLYLGDIVISWQTVQRQCQAHGHRFEEEILWLAAHGFLHLLGWDHPDEVSLRTMWQQQQRLLTAIGYPLPDSAYGMEGP